MTITVTALSPVYGELNHPPGQPVVIELTSNDGPIDTSTLVVYGPTLFSNFIVIFGVVQPDYVDNTTVVLSGGNTILTLTIIPNDNWQPLRQLNFNGPAAPAPRNAWPIANFHQVGRITVDDNSSSYDAYPVGFVTTSNPGPLNIETEIPFFVTGAFSFGLTAAGDEPFGSYTWSVVAGSLPPTVTLTQDTSARAALVDFTTTEGPFAFTLRVDDGITFFDKAYAGIIILQNWVGYPIPFSDTVSASDSVTLVMLQTSQPASDWETWLSLDYGWSGPIPFGFFGVTETFGPGLQTDPDAGREHIFITGVLQSGWTATVTVLPSDDDNRLSIEVARNANWISQARIIEFNTNSFGGGAFADFSAPDGFGVQSYTFTFPGYSPFSPSDVGRTIYFYGGTVPANEGFFTILTATGTVITFMNPGGVAVVGADTYYSLGVSDGSPVSVTVNGMLATVTPTPGDSSELVRTALTAAINALGIVNLTAYDTEDNHPEWSATGVGAAITLLGSGWTSLSFANPMLRVGRTAQVRLFDPDLLPEYSYYFLPAPWYWIVSDEEPVTITITTLTLPNAMALSPYSQPIVAAGGTGFGFIWTLDSGTLPPGLVLAPSGTPSTTLSGTPTTAGVYAFVVRVTDSGSNTDTQAYTITIGAYLALVAASDTIRGGTEVIVSASVDLSDTTRDRTLRSLTPPSSWSTTVSGSGQVAFTREGVDCNTRTTAGSTAGLTSLDSYLNFDACIDVELRFPETVGVPVDLAVLEATSTSGATARVYLRRGVGQKPELTAAFGSLTLAGGQVITGGIVIVDPSKPWTLCLVRNGTFVAGFVGLRDVDGRFTEQHQILGSTLFAADAGTVRFRVANLTYAGRVESTFRNFTVRPHALIDGQLLDKKFTMGPHRILGFIPATTLARLGFRDITVFGLFGETVGVNGFEYTLPPPKTIGRLPSQFLRTYQDVQLSDGDE